MGRVAHKVALVTGAATGIGLVTARRLIEEGARVTITDLSAEAARAAAAELGAGTAHHQHDVRLEADWDRVMTAVSAAEGGLDILVNNAGILTTEVSQTIETTDLEQWRAVQAVNVEGVFLGCRAGVAAMKARGGAIVNLSSIAGIIGTPHIAAYGASKAAVRQLTKSVAVDCGRKGYRIRCNSVHPGPIATAMGTALMQSYGGDVDANWKALLERTPSGEVGEPIDVANCILFLASDEARHVTGAELVVDGGITAV